MSTQSSNIERRFRRLQAKNAERRVTEKKLYQNDCGGFLVSALAAELEPEAGVKVPDFPITAADLLQNMEGAVDVPDPAWKNRYFRYLVPHPGIVFRGIVEAKNAAITEANQRIVSSGRFASCGAAFTAARVKIRAAQILVDFFRFKEGKNGEEMFLGAGYVAIQLVLGGCIAEAQEQESVLKGISVPECVQISDDDLLDNMSKAVAVSAFGGALNYRYRVPAVGSVLNVVRDLLQIAEDVMNKANRDNGGDDNDPVERFMCHWQERLERMPEAEVRLVVYSASDVMDLLADIKKAGRSGNGNGQGRKNGQASATEEAVPDEATDADPPTEADLASQSDEPSDVSPDEQAEYERIAAEYEAERLAKETAGSSEIADVPAAT